MVDLLRPNVIVPGCRRSRHRSRAAASVPCLGRRRRALGPSAATASSRPPDVCASASSSCSRLGRAPPKSTSGAHERVVALRAARDHARGEQVADAVDHRDRAGSISAPTPEPTHSSRRWPSRPKPVTSVAACTPTSTRGVARAAFSVGHHLDRGRRRAPRVAASRFTAVEITPSPIGFVSTSASPGCAPAFVSTRSGCTVPTTARPYFGSASSIEWPPAIKQPAGARDVARRRRARARAARTASPSRGHADEVQREQRGAAHRVHVGERVRRGDAAPVVRVVDDRREEVGGHDDREVVAQPVDRGVVGGVEADEEIRVGRAARGRARDRAPCAGRRARACTRSPRRARTRSAGSSASRDAGYDSYGRRGPGVVVGVRRSSSARTRRFVAPRSSFRRRRTGRRGESGCRRTRGRPAAAGRSGRAGTRCTALRRCGTCRPRPAPRPSS